MDNIHPESKSKQPTSEDFCISGLATDVVSLEARIVNLEAEITLRDERIRSLELDVAIYRDLATAGIHFGHDLTETLERLRVSHHRLLDEYRRLRAQLTGQDEEAA